MTEGDLWDFSASYIISFFKNIRWNINVGFVLMTGGKS